MGWERQMEPHFRVMDLEVVAPRVTWTVTVMSFEFVYWFVNCFGMSVLPNGKMLGWEFASSMVFLTWSKIEMGCFFQHLIRSRSRWLLA